MDWKVKGSPSQILVGNKLHKKASEVASIMNEYFISKINDLRSNFSIQNPDLRGCYIAKNSKKCSLSLEFVSVKDVEKIIKNLRSSKAVSIDGLDSYSIRISARFVANPIQHLITLSIMQQRFPMLWKYAKVIPLHKKDCQLEKKNYRPVSILSPVSKVLEKVIYIQLYHYFSRNKLFHPNVMGYRKKRSTMTAVLQMYDRWVRGASHGKVSGIVLLDLSAAFDLVNPSILCEKLKIYGLNGDFVEWIKCYMENRRQAVWIDHTLSDWLDVSVGVPQGSILGPLLFVIFANDLPYILSCQIDMYADDSTLSSVKAAATDINCDLSENCETVVNWMSSNELCLNVDKTHLLIAGTSQRLSQISKDQEFRVHMNGSLLSESDSKSEKMLGVIFQSNLKWSSQILVLQGKLKDRLAGLRKLKYVISSNHLKIVAESIFHSTLTYCIAVWGGAGKGEIEDLQVLQNQAARIVLHEKWRANREMMFKKLSWMTVNQLIIYHRILAVYSIRKNQEPEYLAKFLTTDNQRGHIIIPHTGLTLLKKSFVSNGAELWNGLPRSLRSLDDSSSFKMELRKWVGIHIQMFQ